MTKISIVYHSGYGHTAKVAEAIAQGIKEMSIDVSVISVPFANASDWEILEKSDAIIFGAPTYMGGVSAEFKKFIDESSKIWMNQVWKDKIAAGFTNSSSYSGDKLASIQQIFHFAMQQCMIWVGQAQMGPILSEHQIPDHNVLNRIGSFSGLMTQANHQAAPDIAPPKGDLETAKIFGKRIATITQSFNK